MEPFASSPARQARTKWWSLTMLVAMLVSIFGTSITAQQAVAAPVGAGFELNASDIRFIRQQIRIAENHVVSATPSDPCAGLLGTGPNQVFDPTLPFGLRTVDGTCNNLQPNQARYGAADRVFPRLLTPNFRVAEPSPFGPPNGPNTTYNTTSPAIVFDSHPRIVSNLVVDQTASNPAAVVAAGLGAVPDASGTLFIQNVAPDEGLSAPYNSWFTLFGQFFDHGLDLVTKGGAGTVFVPLKADDPLFDADGPDNTPNSGDETNFMLLSRASLVGGAREGMNTTTPFVDQNQTYTSHPSHQVFLRAYDFSGGAPVPTGKLLDGALEGSIANWRETKDQAALLGIALDDMDVHNVPLLATDPYGHFIPGSNGFPQLVTAGGLVEGNPGNPVNPAQVGALRTGHAFLDDIAHNAVPAANKTADPDADISQAGSLQPAGTYDDELLDEHFITGDGRGNENIGLTAVHMVFHSEHNRLAVRIDEQIHSLLTGDEVADWKAVNPATGWSYGERLFQAARFVTEMEYQHLVFEEFGRKVQPQINVFSGYDTSIDSAISAEFAHTVYRFGHSMLNETVDRQLVDGTRDDMDLFDAFLNPVAFHTINGQTVDARVAAGAIVQGMTQQAGNEIDEFVTEALRSRLLGLPLDLATINIARARSEGIPGLNEARRQFYAQTGDSILSPYTSWVDLSFNLKHTATLYNLVAAYGTHPDITGFDPDGAGPVVAGSVEARRINANRLLDGLTLPGPDGITGDIPGTIGLDESADDIPPPADAGDFIFSLGAWANDASGRTVTGVDLIDFWVGGLAEKRDPFGGFLGSTFNHVFETQMENLQDGDRFYYLTRTAGLNLLVQLEGNSFAELIMRNTSAVGLPADVFSRPDYSFNVARLGASGPVVNDPATEWNETGLLVRNVPSAGFLRFGGAEHVNWNGMDESFDNPLGVSVHDRLYSGLGDDTLRGNGGNDVLEGEAGNDQHIGGDGDDIITDRFGDDVLKGGRGNDAMASGQGFDLNQGGPGDDFIVGGSDPTESFGGPGDDIIFAGASFDTIFGDDGDDWIEGGGQADLLQGDNGAPFQNDINDPGHDVIIGDGGNDDYDAEGGDDIMLAGPGIERNEGMLGFDWVIYKGDPQPANADMRLTVLLPPEIETNRDRFDLVEGLSGHNLNDTLRGDDRDGVIDPADPLGVEGAFAGHELNPDGISRVSGLAAVLPAGATTFANGNIILGGAGSDLMEGRGGDDIIDGDRWLNVRLMRTSTGEQADSLHAFRVRVFSGEINPGDFTIVRSVETPTVPAADCGLPAASRQNCDTAVYSGAAAGYTITRNANGSVTVSDIGGTDGTDTLWNVEQIQFADQIVSLVSPAPVLSAISPASATAGAAAFTLTVDGSNFVASSVVRWNGANRTTTFVSPTQLTAAIPASDIATAASNNVTVFTPAPGGGTSTAATFTVANAPAPVLTSLSPAAVTAGSGAFTLTVNGSGFASTSVVRVNGVNRATTFVSPTQLQASILASDVSTAGTRGVSVFTPAPGGGTSATVNLTVNATNPAPTITSLSPATVAARSGAFILIVNGTGFVSSSQVRINNATRPTTFVSNTQLRAELAAGDIATAGTRNITVRTTIALTSAAFTLNVVNPGAPTLTSISPATVTAGGPNFTLTVNGSGFVTNSVVRIGPNNNNAANRPTTFVSPTQLLVSVPAGDIATAGTRLVRVFTPSPGGGTSGTLNLTVVNAGVPNLTSISPSTVAAGGSAFTLTVDGSNFVANSVVRVNGTNRTTTFVSSTQLQAIVTAGDIAAAGTRNVTVFTPAPGGGTSTSAALTVTAAPGAAPVVQLLDLDMGTRRVGDTRTRTLTITNGGTVPLVISSATLAAPYSLAIGTCNVPVNPGRSCRLEITFTPTAAGTFNRQLLIYSNAPGSPAVAVITGVGR